jgi:hypothetical protein
VAEDKHRPCRPQLFPSSLDELKRSPIWRQQQEAIAKLRERLPLYMPEEMARLRTPGLPTDANLPPELAEELRRRREQRGAEGLESAQRLPERSEQPESAPERIEQPQSKAKHPGGRPQIEFPHLDDALKALAQKEQEDPRVREEPQLQASFVITYLRGHRTRVDDEQAKTIGRRITTWRKQNSKPSAE